MRIVVQARLAQSQFDDVPVRVLAKGQGRARVIPTRVTVLVTGPQTLLDRLTADDLTVTVDVDGSASARTIWLRARCWKRRAPADEVRVIPARSA